MEQSDHTGNRPHRTAALNPVTALLFGTGWLLLIAVQGLSTGLATLAIAVAAALLARILAPALRRLLACLLLMLPAILTASGSISVLTGFAGSNQHPHWTGISFVCASLAACLFRAPLTVSQWLQCVLPWRYNSGPCALPANPPARPAFLNRRRLRYACSWLLLGAFFYSVPAAALAPLLVLRHSMAAPDILMFALLFEMYVYFNFSGISFMVYGLLKLAGSPVILNFQAPFSARHLPAFWQRWHISLSQVLKLIIFQPLRPVAGIWLAVPAVFLVSALWHGVSLNFILWGSFHALAWLLSHWLLQRGWRTAALMLLPPVVIGGRLIFSEADSVVLAQKFWQLLHWQQASDNWICGIQADWQTAVGLLCAFGWLLCEILLPRRVHYYRLLRKNRCLLLLLLLMLLTGRSGLGGVYGAR